MINLITLTLQLISPLISFFIKKAENKEELKKKMLEFMDRHSDIVMKNAKLRKEYEELKKQVVNKDKS